MRLPGVTVELVELDAEPDEGNDDVDSSDIKLHCFYLLSVLVATCVRDRLPSWLGGAGYEDSDPVKESISFFVVKIHTLVYHEETRKSIDSKIFIG